MRLKRLNFACVIVGLFVSFTAGGDVDSKKLHGTWVASKGIGTIKGFTVTIGPENAFKMEAEGKESVAGKYVVDWTRTPAHLDFDAGEKGKFKTLIELKGDTLKFENVLPGMERPKNFSANVAAFKRGTAVPKKELPVAPVTVEIETDWKPETCFKIKNVDNVHPSPDGRRVAYTVLSVALGQDSKMGSTLVVMDADGANFRTVASGEHFRQVEWSRDGQWLAYLDGVRLMRIRPDGAGGEFITNSVYSFHWSPDGAMIAVTRMLSRLDPMREVDTYSKVVGANFHFKASLSVISMAKNAERRFPERPLTDGDFHDAGGGSIDYSWSHDGKTIAFIRRKSAQLDHRDAGRLWIVDVPTGQLRTLGPADSFQRSPVFSPDDRWIACLFNDPMGFQARVHLIPRDGGPGKILALTPNEAPSLVGWSKGGERVYFFENQGTTANLFALPLDGPAVPVSKLAGVVKDVHLNADGTTIGYSFQTTQTPHEAYLARLEPFQPKQISHVNDHMRKLPIPKTEVIRWKGSENQEIEGILTYPLNYEPGRRSPLILLLHGGPSGVWDQQFVGEPYPYSTALFAKSGFVILQPNPRGSTGYGAKFRKAIINDVGNGDYFDIMAGVDRVIATGIADETRMGIVGWSYGGYLAAWTIGKTNRFKAASVGAGISNLISYGGESELFLHKYFGGAGREFYDVLKKHSPVFLFKDVATPTLIQHGEADNIVHVSQGLELYNCLKRLGCPTKMIVYQGEHGFAPGPGVEVIRHNLAWMSHHLK